MKTAVEAALQLVARRSHNRAELRSKLLKRAFSPEEVQSALERLEELEYIEAEQTLAERYATELARKKGMTPRLAKEKLLKKGFGQSEADFAVDGVFSEWDGLASARIWIEKDTDPKRAARRLQARGYPPSIISTVIRTLHRRNFAQ